MICKSWKATGCSEIMIPSKLIARAVNLHVEVIFASLKEFSN